MGDDNALDVQTLDTEVLPFLTLDARQDLKLIAVQYFLGLTGTEQGCDFILKHDQYVGALVQLTHDTNTTVLTNVYVALVNLSSRDNGRNKILSIENYKGFTQHLIRRVLDRDCPHADALCMLLSNLSRHANCASKFVETCIEHSEHIGLDRVVQAFCLQDFNKQGQQLHFLGPFLANLTQNANARHSLLNHENCVIQRLLPFTQHKESVVRRQGVAAILRNCCFETEHHSWLLSSDVDLLPHLLLPLAGPEEFDEDDMDKLPDDLQYLEPDKQRETEVEIRKMLVEALNQLCTLEVGRAHFKEKNVYVVLRELHKWEQDKGVKLCVEYLIGVLLNDPSPEHADLNHVNIPEDYSEKIEKAKELYLKDEET